MRAVLDPNVLISALLSPDGAPAAAIRAWLGGEFELVVSALLLEELGRALAYPKLRKRVEPNEASRFVTLLAGAATIAEDPTELAGVRSRDPGDDHLIALAARERAVLVSGDDHLLDLEDEVPVFSPALFLERFVTKPGRG